MTDKTTKLLAKLTSKQRQLILAVVLQLQTGNETGLDVKPLKGHKDMFRARIGDYRIIYMRRDGVCMQIAITKRDDQTYRDF